MGSLNPPSGTTIPATGSPHSPHHSSSEAPTQPDPLPRSQPFSPHRHPMVHRLHPRLLHLDYHPLAGRLHQHSHLDPQDPTPSWFRTPLSLARQSLLTPLLGPSPAAISPPFGASETPPSEPGFGAASGVRTRCRTRCRTRAYPAPELPALVGADRRRSLRRLWRLRPQNRIHNLFLLVLITRRQTLA